MVTLATACFVVRFNIEKTVPYLIHTPGMYQKGVISRERPIRLTAAAPFWEGGISKWEDGVIVDY